ncbi:GNAT family N-acetyltransferase [uncultured Paraglaciecola sp.]|uniref:GNAT family N-acetyltransferase n=1 Tax=uncultured Paraglaciecola sp. TaxID=1765024 RepID=UPI0025917E85|nr:GNAT family N-acetyltransferase [uncultured Paraglaciecola sp.]
MCGGLPYSVEKAKGFFEMGRKGWKENKHFIFLLMTQNGDIAACIDIKSPYLKNAEIGYWASRSHRGCMTNTSIALLKLANVAGYTGLFGRAKKENTASAKLLLRTGFKYDMKESENCKTYNYYNVCF